MFLTETEKQKIVWESKQWKYKDKTGQEVLVRDSVNTLLVNLKKYTAFGDLIVQPLPSVVSLAWGGFKVLLQVRMIPPPPLAVPVLGEKKSAHLV